MLKGKTVDAVLNMTNKDIVDSLGNLPSIKVHCSVLGTGALRKTIEDYKNRQKS